MTRARFLNLPHELGERVAYTFGRGQRLDVFFGRWLPGLRVAAAWLAGESRMPWRRFLLWNALGGIGWASTIGTASYFLGKSASGSLGAIGFVGVGIAAVVFLIARGRELIRRRAAANPNAVGHRRSRSSDG